MPLIGFTHDLANVPADAVNVRDVSDSYRADYDGKDIKTYIYSTHVGLCLAERETNGRGDSDFYMTIWNPEKGEANEVCFASTRGWCYPCFGSSVDATSEVRAAYDAWRAKVAAVAAERRAAAEAREPRKGRRVRVVRGRKVPIGTEAVVFWDRLESTSFVGGDGHYWPAKGRIGLALPDGSRAFVDALNVEVVSR